MSKSYFDYKRAGISSKPAVGAFVTGAIVAVFLAFFIQAWIVMLIVGALHATVWTSLPAFGYWGSCLVTLILWFVRSLFKTNNTTVKS